MFLQLLNNIKFTWKFYLLSLKPNKFLCDRCTEILVETFPKLLNTTSSYNVSSIFSWQTDTLPTSINKIPKIDLAFPELDFYFCYAETNYYSHFIELEPRDIPKILAKNDTEIFRCLNTPRALLEEMFRRRLRLSKDFIPILPIFVNPKIVVYLSKDPYSLEHYLDRCWHNSVVWGLRQLPALNQSERANDIVPNTWQSRKLYLEEVINHSLFTV